MEMVLLTTASGNGKTGNGNGNGNNCQFESQRKPWFYP